MGKIRPKNNFMMLQQGLQMSSERGPKWPKFAPDGSEHYGIYIICPIIPDLGSLLLFWDKKRDNQVHAQVQYSKAIK